MLESADDDGDDGGEPGDLLRARCRELYQTLVQHIDLENTLLAPALRESDAFGPLRAAQLLDEHDRLRRVLFSTLAASSERATRELARIVRRLVVDLRSDILREEESLTHPDLLRDDPVAVDATSG